MPTKDGAQFLEGHGQDSGVEAPNLHLTSDDFRQKFYASQRGKELLEKLKVEPEQETVEHNRSIYSSDDVKKLYSSRYRNTAMASLRLLIQRECMLWWRDKATIKARIAQDLLMGVVAGTVFWQGWEDVSSVLGILFQSMLFISIGAMQKVAPQYAVRGVLYKHQDANFFPTWTFVIGRSLASIPASIIDGLLYGTVVYWFVGLTPSFGNYIMFVLIAMVASTGIGLLFSIFSAITRDRSTGQACMSISIVLLILFSGFTVSCINFRNFVFRPVPFKCQCLSNLFLGVSNLSTSGHAKQYPPILDLVILDQHFRLGIPWFDRERIR